jgi:hypothetical protein
MIVIILKTSTQQEPPLPLPSKQGTALTGASAGIGAIELATIPSLPNPADFDADTQASFALAPDLSRNHAAPRHRVLPSAA